MTLTAHAITGATVANLIPTHPVVSFIAGFASHFLMDSIPHWDYRLRSKKEDPQNPMNNTLIIGRDFVLDFLQMATDGFLGLFISLAIFQPSDSLHTLTLFCGIAGGVLPDALQFFYVKLRFKLLSGLQRFHTIVIHNNSIFLQKHYILGIFLQATIISTIALLSKFLS